MSREAIKLALEAAYLAGFNASGEGYNGEYPFGDRQKDPEQDAVWIKDRDNALHTALAEQEPIIKSYLKKDNSQPIKWSDYEPDGMHHNKPKRPPNCGTGYCSCIECVMEPAQQEKNT